MTATANCAVTTSVCVSNIKTCAVGLATARVMTATVIHAVTPADVVRSTTANERMAVMIYLVTRRRTIVARLESCTMTQADDLLIK